MTADRRWLPYAIVLAVGLALGALQFALDDRDPLVFTIPILGLTAIALAVMALSGRGDRADMERVARENGLRYEGIGPLPAVTPLLAGPQAPVHLFTARLADRGPRVRLAEVGRRRIAITDAPEPDVEPARSWLTAHPLRPEAAVEDDLLVVAVDRSAGYDQLLDVVADLRARL